MKPPTLLIAERVPFNLDGRKMYTSEKMELVHLVLKSGEEVALHSNPFDAVLNSLDLRMPKVHKVCGVTFTLGTPNTLSTSSDFIYK